MLLKPAAAPDRLAEASLSALPVSSFSMLACTQGFRVTRVQGFQEARVQGHNTPDRRDSGPLAEDPKHCSMSSYGTANPI
jgi:hypothetical protein